jgi:hypothetical protein
MVLRQRDAAARTCFTDGLALLPWASSRFAGYFFHIGYDKDRQIGKKVAESKETIVVSSQSDCKLGRLIFLRFGLSCEN